MKSNKGIFGILLIMLMAVACSNASGSSENADTTIAQNKPEKQKEVRISGNIAGGEGQQLILQYLKVNQAENIDTVSIESGGNYAFEFLPEADGFYRVMLSENNLFVVIVQDGEEIVVDADASNLYQTYKVKKSEPTKLLMELNKIIYQRDSLGMVMQQAQMNRDQDLFNEIMTIYQPTMEMVDIEIKRFIDKNTSSYASLAALQNLNPDVDYAYFEKVVDALDGIADNNAYYASLRDEVRALKQLAPGGEAPNFTLPTPEGQNLSLSDLQGDYVLIDFWASWCGPCRRENPNVKRVYDRFHEKGFEILGVSLDKNRNAWLAAIQQDGLTWKHVSDLQYWNSSVVPMYQIKGIPLTVLVDPLGNIIAKNLRGPALEQKLEEIFAGK